jgi:hypothetical protein
VRKWTLSACLVLAWSIILLVTASAGSSGHGRPAQANTSTASITQATPATAPGSAQATLDSESAAAMTVKPAVPAAEPAATWTVRPGDTLSAIAAALGVPGGWQTLYAGNRKAIGPDPGLIRPGTVLAAPLSAASSPGTHGQAPGRPPSARPRHQSPPAHGAPAPAQPSSHPAVPGNGTAPAGGTTPRVGATAPGRAMAPTRGGMPGWLEDVLIAAGVLVATAFAAEPAAALARRRQASPGAAPGVPGRNRKPGRAVRAAAKKARIILADHERLVVTYCARDHTVYVLTPPGEDPRAVLRAARLVVPEQTYKQLAGHLGVPAAWPRE